nr:YlmH/Sll1252 family protein [Sedimentibacter sp.]
MKNLEKYYDFIRDEETKNLVKKITDKALYVNKNFIPATTEFINPHVAELSLPIINNLDIKFEIFPSYIYCERKVLILFPEYLEQINCSEFIVGLRIKNKSKFKILNHRDYLGSIMSLGIDRNKTGDIYVYDDYADIVIHSDIADYVVYNLDTIGKSKIEIEKINVLDVHFKEQEHKLLNINCSSIRLDNIVKHLINKSRETASDIIKSRDVKINWQVIDKISYFVEEGDMISISKYGRFKVSKYMGQTKSGKYKVEVKHYI